MQHSAVASALHWKASLLANPTLLQYFILLRLLGYAATSAIYPAISPQYIPANHCESEAVCRAVHSTSASIGHMSIDHRRTVIFMSEEFLDGPGCRSRPPADGSRMNDGMRGEKPRWKVFMRPPFRRYSVRKIESLFGSTVKRWRVGLVRIRPSVLRLKWLYTPFVVSLSNHERKSLNPRALRQAQGERSM